MTGAMSPRAAQKLDRAGYHAASGVLLVVRDPPAALPPALGQPQFVAGNPAEGVEILLALWSDGSVTALNGHVDLGTGIRTALAQIVAEELDLPPHRVHMVLGDTSAVPNQGATIASATIQITAQPLRRAAAQARAWLLQRASQALGMPVGRLRINDGAVSVFEEGESSGAARQISFGALVGNGHTRLMLDSAAATKPPEAYRIVGESFARVDIPAKVAGELIYVHDMRMPGMLHGRVVRPPYAGADNGDFIGNTLESVDERSIAHIPGIRAVVVIRDFVGVVAEREEHAEQAMETAGGALEAVAGHARSFRYCAGLAHPDCHPTPAGGRGRCGWQPRGHAGADATDLRVALADARIDRALLRRR